MTYYSGLILFLLSFSLLNAQTDLYFSNKSPEKKIFEKFSMTHNIQPGITESEANSYNIGQTFLNDFTDSWDTGINILTVPLHFSSNDWLTTGIVAGSTILLFAADRSVKEINNSNQTNAGDKIFIFDKYFGTQYTAFFTAGLYGYGLFSGDNDIRKLGLKASQAFIYSGLIEVILKPLIGRRRPHKGENQLFFKPFQLADNDYQSLPSGHTTIAFAVSTVMADYYDNIFWKVFWFGSAGMVGLSRIYNNQHWASDVFLGAAIGYFTAQFVLNSHSSSNEKDPSEISVTLSPVFSSQGSGVGLNLRF